MKFFNCSHVNAEIPAYYDVRAATARKKIALPENLRQFMDFEVD
jgi:hypothetical protein